MKPLFRWVGGKRRMLPHLLKHVPDKFGTYIEPFAGAAALFCHLEPRGRAILCDANADLMITYAIIRDMPKALCERLASMPVSEEFYYELRLSSAKDSMLEVAARFLYLNRYGVNGMWRVNAKGNMNTPFDHRRADVQIDGYEFMTGISKLSEVLTLCDPTPDPDWPGGMDTEFNRTILLTGNYRNATRLANTGDLVYMDPPYVPFTANGHVAYTDRGFTWDDHVALRDEFVRLDKLGCHVILTNADIPAVRELYKSYNLDSVSTKASVARTAGQGSYGELIVSNLRKNEL